MHRGQRFLVGGLVLALTLWGLMVVLQRAFFPSDRDLGIILTLRPGEPRAVALDSAGTRLGVVEESGEVRIVAVADGHELRRVPAWDSPSASVATPEPVWARSRVAF